MADTKISALAELAEAPATDDMLVVVDKSDTTMAASGTNKRITPTNLMAGKTLYDWVVAASGGTHTTLGAAITAASAGDTIFVRSGTYTEAGVITSSLADITIIGENREKSVISMGANALSLTGNKVVLQNLRFNWTTSAFTINGAEDVITNCYFVRSATTETNIGLTLGASLLFQGNYFESTATTTSSSAYDIRNGSSIVRVSNNYFRINSSMGDGHLIFEGSGVIFDDNYISYNGTGTNYTLKFTNNAIVSGNFFANPGNDGKALYVPNPSVTITGNTFNNWNTGIDQTGATNGNAQITGNQFINIVNAIILNGPRCVVTGNKINGRTASTGISMSGTTDNTIISGNMFSSHGTVAITIASGSENNAIVGNTFVSNTANLTDASLTSTIRHNVGLATTLEKEMSFMTNTSGGTINAGNLVVWKAVAVGTEVTTTTIAGDDKVYGVATAAISDAASGYIQTLGKTTLLTVDGTTDIAIGDPLTAFTTAGIAAKAATGDMVFAYALEAYTADNSNGVIDALLITPRLI